MLMKQKDGLIRGRLTKSMWQVNTLLKGGEKVGS